MSSDSAGHGLDQLPDAERGAMLAALRRRTYPADAVVLAEGDMTTDFFVIIEGAVEVLRGGSRVDALGAGDFFGEVAAVDPGPGYTLARNATIRTTAPSEIGILGEQAFGRLLRAAPAFRETVQRALGHRG